MLLTRPLRHTTLMRRQSLCTLSSQVTKGAEPLNPFSFAIEKRNPSKYSSTVTKKGEREKKTMLVYRGRFALLASFYAPFKT